MSISTQEMVAGIDPTGRAAISGAEMLQMIQSGTPASQRGFIVYSIDLSEGVPDVPNANSVTRYQRYIWVRKQFSTGANLSYVWSPYISDDPTFLKWKLISEASVADGSVTTVKLANNAVTDAKVANVAYSKIVGAPNSLPPSGAAGGDLTGTYPDPTIGANKVTASKLSSDASVDANRAVTTNHIRDAAVLVGKLGVTGGTALQLQRVNAGGTAIEFFSSPIANLAGLGTAFQSPRMTPDGTAVEWGGPGLIQQVSTVITSEATSTAVIPLDNTEPQITEGTQLTTLSITPKSATSLLILEFSAGLIGMSVGAHFIGAFFQGSTANAIAAGATWFGSVGETQQFRLTHRMTSGTTSPITFQFRYGPSSAGSAYINRYGSGSLFNLTARAVFTIREVLF